MGYKKVYELYFLYTFLKWMVQNNYNFISGPSRPGPGAEVGPGQYLGLWRRPQQRDPHRGVRRRHVVLPPLRLAPLQGSLPQGELDDHWFEETIFLTIHFAGKNLILSPFGGKLSLNLSTIEKNWGPTFCQINFRWKIFFAIFIFFCINVNVFFQCFSAKIW
jgi:hypothetical protein